MREWISKFSLVGIFLVSIFLINTVSAAASAPSPQITVNSYPGNITLGQKAIITISGKNNGGDSPEAYFSVSFPDNPHNVRIVSSNAPNYYIYTKGVSEWGGYGQTQFTLEYPHAEGWAIPWPNSVEYSLTVEVIPEKIGTFYFFVKMTAMDSGLANRWLSDPSSSDTKDQQNEYVRVYSINVQQSEILGATSALTPIPMLSPTPTITPKYATLTVDNSGGADYKRIQDAINVANDGDTILVYSGTYHENVDVNKQLVLRGIGKPVVDAGGGSYAIILSAGNSMLEGFTAVNAGNLREIAKEFKSSREGVEMKSVRGDAGIRVESDNNIIRNNTALNNEEGIRVDNSNNNIVSGNTATNNYLSIYLHYSNNNTVSGNKVSDDIANNIYLWYSNRNIITGNNVRNFIGIDKSSNYNILYQNNLANAHDGGSNQWDNGINMGNYWSDYRGADANNDGIDDTPYNISGGGRAQDSYPLMAPYVSVPTPNISVSPTPAIFSSDVKAHEANYKLLWSYVTGESESGFIGFGDILVSSDGQYIAAASDNRKIYFFNRKGELLWSYEIAKAFFESSKDIPFIEFSVSSDGSYIAAMFKQPNKVYYKVYFFNKEGKFLWSKEIGGSTIVDSTSGGVSISSDGSYIAVGSDDTVYYFNRDGELLWSYKTPVYDVSVSADGSYIAVGGGGVNILNREGKLLWNSKTNDWIDEVSVSADSSYIAAKSQEKKVYLFNKEGVLLWSYTMEDFVSGLSVSSDGSYIAVGTSGHHTTDKWVENGIVYFFSKEGKLLWSYGTNKSIDSISISSDGSYIAAGSDRVYLFNREGKLLWNSRKVDGWFSRVSLSSDGSSIAAWSLRRNIYFFGLNVSTTDGSYPELVIVETDGEINLSKKSLSFGDTLNIKARIKLIGSEKIYGVPYLEIYGPVPVGIQGPYKTNTIVEWQLTRTNQVIKEVNDDEFRWILPGDEFNFDVNWKWEDTGISPGTYMTQVNWHTPDNERVWGKGARDEVQLMGVPISIPIPISAFPISMLLQEIIETKINNIGINNLVMVISFIVFIIIYLALRPK